VCGARPYHSLRLLYAWSLQNVQTASGAYPGVKRPGRESDHNILARFMSGAILPLPLYAIMVYMGTAVALSKYGRCKVRRDSIVGIANRYGQNGPGIESRWERDFPHLYTPALGSTQPPRQWIPGLSRG
jgi:hypothetical protein